MRMGTTASLGVAMLLLLMPATASAHAQLLSSTPAADATLTELPPAITLTYDEELTATSSFDVVDASGRTLATGTVDPAAPKSMTGATPALPNGSYEIRWTAGTADGDIVRATFAFRVAIVTPAPATPAPTGAETAAPATPAPTGGNGTAASSADVLVPIIAVAVLVIGGLAFFLRRRSAA